MKNKKKLKIKCDYVVYYQWWDRSNVIVDDKKEAPLEFIYTLTVEKGHHFDHVSCFSTPWSQSSVAITTSAADGERESEQRVYSGLGVQRGAGCPLVQRNMWRTSGEIPSAGG